MGNQKHKNKGMTISDIRRIRWRFEAERARNGSDNANIDKGISISRPNGKSAKNEMASQLGQSVDKRLSNNFIGLPF